MHEGVLINSLLLRDLLRDHTVLVLGLLTFSIILCLA